MNLSTGLEFPLTRADRGEAERLLASETPLKRPLVGVHPGSSAPARRWPLAKFAELIDQLQDEHGATVLLLGGPEDVDSAGWLERGAARPVTNLAGRTSLGGLAAVIDRLDLYIGNDSGPAHIAAARRTPSVTIFGPVDVERWGPLNRELNAVARRPVACSPCGLRECPIDHRCLAWLEVDEVLALAASSLERARVR
jgi:ADP-heptose:LPS heptosyltransferase